mgnify:CR=1 FL=1
MAIEKGYDFVVCGHIHHAEMRLVDTEKGKVTYLNSGDWVESLTALEYQKGAWEIFKYSAKNFEKEEIEVGDFSDGEDLKSKLDVMTLLQKIKLEIA